MTHDEVLELRRWSAEVLMEWHLNSDKRATIPLPYYETKSNRFVMEKGDWEPDAVYTGQWLMVVERMRGLGIYLRIEALPLGSENATYACTSYKSNGKLGEDNTNSWKFYCDKSGLGTAVLRAAKAALEAKP